MSSTAEAPLVRLRPSVSFAPMDDGILFKDWDRSFTVTGNRSLYSLFERLLPHLERGIARDALLGALPESVRGVVVMLLERLEEHGMSFAAATEMPVEAEAFPQALAYLESVAPDPYAAFARIRAARVAAVGGGGALFAAIRALAAMGVGRLDCWIAPADAPAVQACLQAHQPLVAGEVHLLDDEHTAAAAAEGDLLIHLQDGAARAAIDRVAAATMRPLLQGVLGEDVGLAGPLRMDGGPGLADTLARSRHSFAAEGTPVAPVVAGLLGNAAAFEAFKHLAGVSTPAAEGRAVMVTREPLAVSHHPVLGLGLAAVPGQVSGQVSGQAPDTAGLQRALAEMRALESPPAQQVLIDHLREIADEALGILALPHPGELPQVPVFTCRATARGVAGEAFGFADDPSEAYLRAGVEGLRRLAAAGAARDLPTITLDGAAGRPMLRTAMSLAVAHSYDAWLQQGIQGCLCRRLTDPAAAGPPVAVRRIDHAALTGATALRWKTLTLRFGCDVAAVHATPPAVPGVHLAAVIVNGATAGLSAGTTPAAAIDDALREAMARVALAEVGVALPPHPPVAATDAAGTADTEASWDARGSLATTLDALARCGIAVVVHPWAGIPALRRRGFLAGWVGLDVG